MRSKQSHYWSLLSFSKPQLSPDFTPTSGSLEEEPILTIRALSVFPLLRQMQKLLDVFLPKTKIHSLVLFPVPPEVPSPSCLIFLAMAMDLGPIGTLRSCCRAQHHSIVGSQPSYLHCNRSDLAFGWRPGFRSAGIVLFPFIIGQSCL